jgi:hypothetical protein
VGKSLEHGQREIFLKRPPMAYAIRSIINKWDLIKSKGFYKARDTVNNTKRPPIDWERIFNNPKFDRRLLSNIYKELKKLDSTKPNNPI